jgi:hypothetical protein
LSTQDIVNPFFSSKFVLSHSPFPATGLLSQPDSALIDVYCKSAVGSAGESMEASMILVPIPPTQGLHTPCTTVFYRQTDCLVAQPRALTVFYGSQHSTSHGLTIATGLKYTVSMSITFGSVGDIIAVVQIAWSLAKALADSAGSAKEYQDLIKELQTFDEALLHVCPHFLMKQNKSLSLTCLFTGRCALAEL